MIAGAKPKKRGRIPQAQDSRIVMGDSRQVLAGWKYALRTDQSFDLKNERVKRGKINQSERAKYDPASQQVRARSFSWSFRSQEPVRNFSETVEHGVRADYIPLRCVRAAIQWKADFVCGAKAYLRSAISSYNSGSFCASSTDSAKRARS